MSEPSVYATKAFWTGLMERTIKVAGATAAGTIGTTAVGMAEVDWTVVGSATLLAAIVNVLVCFSQPKFVAGESDGATAVGDQIEYIETVPRYRNPETPEVPTVGRYVPPVDDDDDHEVDPNGLPARDPGNGRIVAEYPKDLPPTLP